MSYSQQAHHLVLRLPEHLEETVRARLKEGSMEGVQLTARHNVLEGLEAWASKPGLMELTIDGERYPARLVNLPCVVEIHKTIDYVTLFKSGDIGQMVVVYANDEELLQDLQKEKEVSEKNNKDKKKENTPAAAQQAPLDLDYYHSGLTPPTTNIVRRRFQETRMHGPYPVEIVSKVQGELAAHVQALEDKKEIVETVEDIVDFEEYMADPTGHPIAITEESQIWTDHPELMIHRPVELAPDDPVLAPPPPPQPAPLLMPPPLPVVPQQGSPMMTNLPTGGKSRRGGGRGRGMRGGYRGGGRAGRANAWAAAAAAARAEEEEEVGIAIDDIVGESGGGGGKGGMDGELDLPPPPPAHRTRPGARGGAPSTSTSTSSIGTGGTPGRAGSAKKKGAAKVETPPAPDLPPHDDPPLEEFFGGDDGDAGDDDFFKFLEGGMGELGGLTDEVP